MYYVPSTEHWANYRDQGGTDKSTSNPDNFLGEVLLNIGKLKPWDGIILEQVFELRQVQNFAGTIVLCKYWFPRFINRASMLQLRAQAASFF